MAPFSLWPSSLISLIIFSLILLSTYRSHSLTLTESYRLADSVKTRHTPIGPSYSWDLGELPAAMVDIQNTIQYQLEGPTADTQWDLLVPKPLKGQVLLGRDKKPYMLSMFHQLQCLDIIRTSYIDGARGGNMTHSALTRHCMNYLRQTVMCRADLKLERVVDPNGPHAVQVREPQKCRNWNVVYERVAVAKAEIA